jgi:hypothetical protein
MFFIFLCFAPRFLKKIKNLAPTKSTKNRIEMKLYDSWDWWRGEKKPKWFSLEVLFSAARNNSL